MNFKELVIVNCVFLFFIVLDFLYELMFNFICTVSVFTWNIIITKSIFGRLYPGVRNVALHCHGITFALYFLVNTSVRKPTLF